MSNCFGICCHRSAVLPFWPTRSIHSRGRSWLAGRITGIEIAPVVMVRALDEVEAAFAAIAKERAGAVVVQAGIFFQNAIADLAIKYQLPSASVLRPFVAPFPSPTYRTV